MSFMECPGCGGSGRVDDATGEKLICSICEGTGALPSFDDPSLDEGETPIDDQD